MSYIKIGFKLAVGWYMGNQVIRAVSGIGDDMVKRYVPEKYWNRRHPEYPFQQSKEHQEQPTAKCKIGFSID